MLHRISFRVFIQFAALLIMVITFFPFYWIIVTSLRPAGQIYQFEPSLLPTILTVENYVNAFVRNNIGLFIRNSLFVVGTSIIITTMISTMAAYALARMKFHGRILLRNGIVVTQMFPLVVLLVPLYLFSRSVGLYNSHQALIIPYIAMQVPVSTVLIINYFAAIPKELDESARLDGCDRLQVFFRILLPLSTPGIAASSIYCFINLWQEFLLASTMLTSHNLYTLTVGLSVFRGQHSTDWGGLMATSVVIALPSLLLFTLAQQFFINNMAGSIKG